MPNYSKIDLVFLISGKILAVDHGYALYSAVSQVCPQIHAESDIGLKLIRGRYLGDGQLDISPASELVLRLPTHRLRDYLVLAGKTLVIRGDKILVGVPHVRALSPASTLFSPLVTSKNGQDRGRFQEEMQRQLMALAIHGRVLIGRRKTFAVHGKQIVGYEVLVTELTGPEAILLQEAGLGGRRKMGCGFFEPRRFLASRRPDWFLPSDTRGPQ